MGVQVGETFCQGLGNIPSTLVKTWVHFQKENIFNLLFFAFQGGVASGSGLQPVQAVKYVLNPGVVGCGLYLARRQLSCSDHNMKMLHSKRGACIWGWGIMAVTFSFLCSSF